MVNGVSDAIGLLVNSTEAEYWPEDMLTMAATCFLMADTALKQWRAGNFEECLA